MDDDSEKKNTKGTKKCIIKRRLMFENCKDSFFNNKTILRPQLRLKSNHNNLYTEEVNKIALNSNDDKILQTFDDYINENKTEHNKSWPYTPDHPYRILIIEGSGFGKTNVLLNLIENQPDIDKIYLFAKDPYEAKYQ